MAAQPSKTAASAAASCQDQGTHLHARAAASGQQQQHLGVAATRPGVASASVERLQGAGGGGGAARTAAHTQAVPLAGSAPRSHAPAAAGASALMAPMAGAAESGEATASGAAAAAGRAQRGAWALAGAEAPGRHGPLMAAHSSGLQGSRTLLPPPRPRQVVLNCRPDSVVRSRRALYESLVTALEGAGRSRGQGAGHPDDLGDEQEEVVVVVERELQAVDLVLSPSLVVAVWPYQAHAAAPGSGQAAGAAADELLPALQSFLLDVSMRYSRAVVVLEAPEPVANAVLQRSGALHALALKAGLLLTLLTSPTPELTQVRAGRGAQASTHGRDQTAPVLAWLGFTCWPVPRPTHIVRIALN